MSLLKSPQISRFDRQFKEKLLSHSQKGETNLFDFATMIFDDPKFKAVDIYVLLKIIERYLIDQSLLKKHNKIQTCIVVYLGKCA